MEETRYWVIVASRDHVQNGIRLGIVQANHGKSSPLKRMKPGDLILCYSPKVQYKGTEPCKKFTAIARVKPGEVYQGHMAGNFDPQRRDVEFLPCKEVDILPLISKLGFIRKKESWGFVFKFGFFEIPKEDFNTIAKKMDLKMK